MHFSMLPLLLFFVSAICAAPIDIHMVTIHGVKLQKVRRDNLMYAAWDMHVSLGEKEYEVDTIKDVDRAWKMKDGGDILVKVKVMDTDLAHAKAMIDRVNRHWGWDWVSHNEIAFVLQMKRSDENLVEEYLGHKCFL